MSQVETRKETSDQRPMPPTYTAEDLTRGGNQAWIEHGGQTYVLRITRAGKLILTK